MKSEPKIIVGNNVIAPVINKMNLNNQDFSIEMSQSISR